MTIDLGFAWTTLPSGAQVAFVDVPGHERFVPNMLAGVGPGARRAVRRRRRRGLDAAVRRAPGRPATPSASGTACSSSPAPTWPTRRRRRPQARAEIGRGPSLGEVRRGRGQRGHRRRASTSCAPRSTGWSPGCRRPTPTRRSGSGSTARSPSGAPARWSPARCGAGRLRAGDELELPGVRRPVRVRGLQALGAGRRPRSTAVARVAVNLRGVDADDVAPRRRPADPGHGSGRPT